jgi:glycosyltransferase involved in cell wall biosynthesis
LAWVEDFAAARNEALARATGDHAFWLDADDVVDPGRQEKLRKLLDGLRPSDEAGYMSASGRDGVGIQNGISWLG